MPITFAADLVPDISGLKGNHVTIVSYPRSCKVENYESIIMNIISDYRKQLH